MKNMFYAVAVLSSLIGINPSAAETLIQRGGPLPVEQFTQCDVAPRYTLNTRAHALSRGGWGFKDNLNGQWTRSYGNGVFVAERHLRSLPYTYLEPVDGSGVAPCQFN